MRLHQIFSWSSFGRAWFLMVGSIGFTVPMAQAHHSFAMFDNAKRVQVQGKVTAFQWTNPHVFIELDVIERGRVKHFTIECASPTVLRDVGWNRTLIKSGDTIKVEILPLRDGRPGGLMNFVWFGDGRKLGNANNGVVTPANEK